MGQPLKKWETSDVLYKMLKDMDQESLNDTRKEMEAPVVYLIPGEDIQEVLDKLCALTRTCKDPDNKRSLQKVISILSTATFISKNTYLNDVIDKIHELLL